METISHSSKEIIEIAEIAKNMLNVTADLDIQNAKTFKLMTKLSEENGGSYSYAKDRVSINKDVSKFLLTPHLEWMIFHEFGHAYMARSFARGHFYPAIIYASWIQDDVIVNGIRHMWNGLCDCFVNELILQKKGMKKFDPTLEKTIDEIDWKLAYAMCFHLFDYWRHGQDDKIAQRAKAKIPLEILNVLQNKLSLTSLDSPVNDMMVAMEFITKQVFRLEVSTISIPKKLIQIDILRATLPEFWGDDTSELALMKIG